jgi:hypothetical protein
LQLIDPASVPKGFKIVENLSSTLLLPGESTTFAVELDDTVVGTFAGTLQILSSDHDEPAFTIGLKGSVFDPTKPYVRQIDDGNTGSLLSSGWTRTTGRGAGLDVHSTNAGAGSRQARWSFYNLPSGTYRIYGTWTVGSTNATNAPFTVLSWGQMLTSFRVNQRVAPSGPSANGVRWKLLGTLNLAGSQLTIKLTNAANGIVVADAIRLERIPDNIDGTPLPESNATIWLPTTSASSLAPAQTRSQLLTDSGSSWLDHDELDLLESITSLLALARQRTARGDDADLLDSALSSLLAEFGA